MGFFKRFISNILTGDEKKIDKSSMLYNFLFGPNLVYKKEEIPEEESITVRGAEITKKEFDELARPIVFGEVSNRPVDKKDLESRVILNTAINRMAEYKNRGKTASLSDILTAPNQYQAYEGDQFKLYGEAKEKMDVDKKEEIDKILDTIWGEMKADKFKDTTNNSFYYSHKPTGEIFFDDTKKLFAD